MPGAVTFPVDVSGVTKDGFWLLLDGEELFVSFIEFPWFRVAPVAQLFHVERPQPHHLFWPELDIDIAVESIRRPEEFPLVSVAKP